MSVDEMPVDEVSVDEVSVDALSIDVKTLYKMTFFTFYKLCNFKTLKIVKCILTCSFWAFLIKHLVSSHKSHVHIQKLLPKTFYSRNFCHIIIS
jgi:hypothetical protein